MKNECKTSSSAPATAVKGAELEGELNHHGITEAMHSGSLPGPMLWPLRGMQKGTKRPHPGPKILTKETCPHRTRTASGMPFQKLEVLEGFARRWECFWQVSPERIFG